MPGLVAGLALAAVALVAVALATVALGANVSPIPTPAISRPGKMPAMKRPPMEVSVVTPYSTRRLAASFTGWEKDDPRLRFATAGLTCAFATKSMARMTMLFDVPPLHPNTRTARTRATSSAIVALPSRIFIALKPWPTKLSASRVNSSIELDNHIPPL